MDISRDALPEYARAFVEKLPQEAGCNAYVVGLKGELGAGKTTFVQEVARCLGVSASVTSPTFVIAQTYPTTHPVFSRLVHIDAYRLEGEEKDTIGFAEFRKDPHTLILIEWPVHLPTGFPAGAPLLEFETVDENTRRITEHAAHA